MQTMNIKKIKQQMTESKTEMKAARKRAKQNNNQHLTDKEKFFTTAYTQKQKNEALVTIRIPKAYMYDLKEQLKKNGLTIHQYVLYATIISITRLKS